MLPNPGKVLTIYDVAALWKNRLVKQSPDTILKKGLI
jgi:hypothetical protein